MKKLSNKSISWKTVFNSGHHDLFWRYGMESACTAAKAAGYEFFTWNGWVYETSTGLQTEILTDSLDEQIEKNDSITLTRDQLKALHELPDEDFEETDIMTAQRMGRNSLVLELIDKIKGSDYDSN